MGLLAVPVLAVGATTIAIPLLQGPPTIAGSIDTSWTNAAALSLDTDFAYRRPATEPTTVRIGQDGNFLDIAFAVTQKERMTAATHTNGSGVQTDDYVGVYLFPGGTQGFSYSFLTNPSGARYQTSSENSAYAPSWAAAGKRTLNGYSVTMRIPLDAIRSGGTSTWHAQFVRAIVATNSLDVWTFSTRQTSATDPAFAGTLTRIGSHATVSARPKARAQIYTLGEVTPASNGGSTSRLGTDFALPVTPTASFVATLHPDYSNVEVDQQSIAPTAFARQYSEVRPFFTQVASPFNHHFVCFACPTTLYTPAIPTFRAGYALEGTQGPLTFGAFDAVGTGRLDAGETVNYAHSDPDRVFGFNTQRISVDGVGGLHDDVTTFGGGYENTRRHLFAYANGGEDRGSAISDRRLADYAEYGTGYSNSTASAIMSYTRIGAQFNPIDGYVAQTDIEGLSGVLNKTWTFTTTAPLHDLSINTYLGNFHNHLGQRAQRNASASLNVDFRNFISANVFTSYTGIRTYANEFLPFSGNGFALSYRGQTSTPISLTYTGGQYFNGHLDAWTYLATYPIARKLRLTLETDESNYLSTAPGEPRAVLWLERAIVDVQLDREASFDFGARRIFGTNIPNAIAPPNFAKFNAGNVSAAFHLLHTKNEFYIVYGDPNSLATTPAFFVKWIRYIGAPKGT